MLFKKSKGKCIYLGEWHTHPEDYPTPSSLDRKSLVDQILKSQLNSNKIFGIIIGLKGLHISLVKKTGIQYERQLKYEDLSCPVDTWSIDS